MRSGRWGGEPLPTDEFAYMVLAKLHGQRLLRGEALDAVSREIYRLDRLTYAKKGKSANIVISTSKAIKT
jgi:hypothetical protein